MTQPATQHPTHSTLGALLAAPLRSLFLSLFSGALGIALGVVLALMRKATRMHRSIGSPATTARSIRIALDTTGSIITWQHSLTSRSTSSTNRSSNRSYSGSGWRMRPTAHHSPKVSTGTPKVSTGIDQPAPSAIRSNFSLRALLTRLSEWSQHCRQERLGRETKLTLKTFVRKGSERQSQRTVRTSEKRPTSYLPMRERSLSLAVAKYGPSIIASYTAIVRGAFAWIATRSGSQYLGPRRCL
jgi:hypothetical protein